MNQKLVIDNILDYESFISRIKNLSDIKKSIIIIALYILLTIILTYPVAFQIGNYVPGGGDAFQWMFILWYTGYALTNPDITTLTHNNLIFYPEGVDITPFSSAFNQVLYLLLSPFLELHVIYTVIWLLTFIIGAFGTYLLVRYLTNNIPAAFVSGIIFAFAPYHFVHALGHLGATTIEWIPFCALFLMKTFREGGRKNSILAGIFFVLVAMSDLQYMIFMGLFAILLFLFELYKVYFDKKMSFLSTIKEIFLKYLPFGIVSFIGILPLTINDILVATSGSNFLKPNPMESITYSTDLLSFFIPCRLHPIFGGMVSPIYNNFLGNYSEHTTYIGYTVLLLSIFAFIKLKKQREVQFWALSAISFSILSLGPLLSINGKTEFTVFNATLPLPHLILYYIIPFLDNCRTTGRFYVIASLAFAVLAGYGIAKILENRDAKRDLIAIIIMIIIIFEYLCVPFGVSYVDQPEFYKEISLENESYAILEIPATKNYEAGVKIEYYSTIHGKSMIGGKAARIPEGALDFEKRTPFIYEITFLKPLNDFLVQEKENTSISVLRYYDIRYIILHKNYFNSDDLQFAQDLLKNLNNSIVKISENDKYTVYQIEEGPYQNFMMVSNGWNTPEEQWNGGRPGRWMNNSAEIKIISIDDQDSILSFEVGSLDISRDLIISLNNELIGKYNINTINYLDVTPDNIELKINLKKGENIIKFTTPQKGTIPSEIGAWNDERELSLAFQNIKLNYSPNI